MLILASSLARDVAALRSHHSGLKGNSSIPCPYTKHHAEYQPMRRISAKQPLADEMQAQDSLALTPHSPIGMEASLTTTHFQAMAPQSETEVSLPPQVIVEEARKYDGPGGSGSQHLNLHIWGDLSGLVRGLWSVLPLTKVVCRPMC